MNNNDITEITIYIDSANRNTNLYPNPFNFAITFDDVISSIPIKMKHIKYIKIPFITLPNTCVVNIDNTTGLYSMSEDKKKFLCEHRYLSFGIDELILNNTFFNDNKSENVITFLYRNNSLNSYCDRWKPYYLNICYLNNELITLKHMTTNLYDENKNKINVIDQNNNVLNLYNLENITDENIKNSIINVRNKIQTSFTIIFGIRNENKYMI
jgi:hypothetical protein